MKLAMKVIGVLCLLMVVGCVSTGKYEDLEKRISKLEKAKSQDLMVLAEQTGARKFWWRNNLTGGTASDLDGIDDDNLTDGDAAIVAYKSGTTMTLYFYVYDKDDASEESSPAIIECSPGEVEEGGAWFLASVQVTGLTGNAADGYRYWQAYNATGFSGTPAEGMCYWKDSTNCICCYDADTTTWLCVDWNTGAVEE